MAIIHSFKLFDSPIERQSPCLLTLTVGHFDRLSMVEVMPCDLRVWVMKTHAVSTLFMGTFTLRLPELPYKKSDYPETTKLERPCVGALVNSSS